MGERSTAWLFTWDYWSKERFNADRTKSDQMTGLHFHLEFYVFCYAFISSSTISKVLDYLINRFFTFGFSFSFTFSSREKNSSRGLLLNLTEHLTGLQNCIILEIFLHGTLSLNSGISTIDSWIHSMKKRSESNVQKPTNFFLISHVWNGIYW